MKLTAKQRKYYSELSRKIAVGLASGLLFVGIGQYPSIAFAHPDPSTTGSYSTTGDVSGGKYTVEQGSGFAVTTEAAGGAAVDPDNKTLSFESQLADLDALVDYLCERFSQDQVIIMGHSYGTMLGSRYALAHPEKVAAYIGIGQCVNEKDYAGEKYSYEDALAIARANGDDTTEMEASYEKFMTDMSIANLLELRAKVEPYHPQAVTKDISTMAALTSPITGVDDMRWYFLQMGALTGDTRYEELVEKPLAGYMMDFNALETGDAYRMPVMLISGSCDWICPVGLVEDYMDVITAPEKELKLIEGCGHSPQGQLPEEFCQEVKSFLGK